jgi:anhydro-N-acetylmuramic acid kinase
MIKHKVLGLMSGTSLDGLDIAFCEFIENDSWDFKILEAETIPYTEELRRLLIEAETSSAIDYFYKEVAYSRYTANCCIDFLKKHNLQPDIISAHGHTIFHEPQKGITRQMLDGSILAASTNIKTICDFRRNDVALGGQGAPLVPVGDQLLMAKYNYCLNIGGIANISYQEKDRRLAFDICPANMALNFLVSKLNLPYDKDGELARIGVINLEILEKLNSLAYYTFIPPKSLGKEWFIEFFKPIIDTEQIKINDLLRTVTEHIAYQISLVVLKSGSMLVTGGGTFNKFLIERIKAKTNLEVVIPDENIINFKEAMIFAFLGLLKSMERTNSLASVTGAIKDCSGGIIYTI